MSKLELDEILAVYEECGLQQSDLDDVQNVHDFPLPNKLVSEMSWLEIDPSPEQQKEKIQMVYFG